MPGTDNRSLRRLGLKMGIRRLAGVAGYELVRRHYYSPVPDVDDLPADTWSRKSALTGIRFEADRGLAFVQDELAPYIQEYRPPSGPTDDPRQFYLRNGFYEGLDAETLYAMVRHLRPRRILELGSGFSTLVIADARARSETADESDHVVYDPHPRPDLLPVVEEVASLHRTAATAIPLEAFAQLRAGDILFVDTTHTVKLGGDVNRIVLDVLPTLAPGVYVHFHDIFLPWEYPREFTIERRFFWAEQYLLQAFLAFNNEFEIIFGTHALKRMYPDAIVNLIPGAAQSHWPGALWLRRASKK